MRLADFLSQERMTATEFAAKVGVSQPCMSRYLAGQRRPAPEIINRIFRLTRGKVSANDFFLTDTAS
jgi:DNA-binding transcriptional regulator YdaS (Cro superfamily)